MKSSKAFGALEHGDIINYKRTPKCTVERASYAATGIIYDIVYDSQNNDLIKHFILHQIVSHNADIIGDPHIIDLQLTSDHNKFGLKSGNYKIIVSNIEVEPNADTLGLNRGAAMIGVYGNASDTREFKDLADLMKQLSGTPSSDRGITELTSEQPINTQSYQGIIFGKIGAKHHDPEFSNRRPRDASPSRPKIIVSKRSGTHGAKNASGPDVSLAHAAKAGWISSGLAEHFIKATAKNKKPITSLRQLHDAATKKSSKFKEILARFDAASNATANAASRITAEPEISVEEAIGKYLDQDYDFLPNLLKNPKTGSDAKPILSLKDAANSEDLSQYRGFGPARAQMFSKILKAAYEQYKRDNPKSEQETAQETAVHLDADTQIKTAWKSFMNAYMQSIKTGKMPDCLLDEDNKPAVFSAEMR